MAKAPAQLNIEDAEIEVAGRTPTPADLMALAINKSESGTEMVEVIERLAALMERENARLAERDFNAAMANFQSSCPKIPKKRSQGGVGNSGTRRNVRYAALEDIDDVIRPLLRDNGLSYAGSFVNDDANGKSWMLFRVTVRHIGGHSETYDGPKIPYDSKLSANDSQRGGSTASYSVRYAIGPALGLVFQGDDTDGAPPDHSGGVTNKIDDNQAANLQALIEETNTVISTFCAFFDVTAISEITKAQYAKAINMLERKRDRR